MNKVDYLKYFSLFSHLPYFMYYLIIYMLIFMYIYICLAPWLARFDLYLSALAQLAIAIVWPLFVLFSPFGLIWAWLHHLSPFDNIWHHLAPVCSGLLDWPWFAMIGHYWPQSAPIWSWEAPLWVYKLLFCYCLLHGTIYSINPVPNISGCI